MAAGLGFKTFQTGEVLTAADTNGYLMQGVLVFANAAARDAAITSPQEGQCCYLKDTDAVLTYSGTAWVGFDDSNAIQNAIINAKGDLIAGSANDTPAILSAGANGETLVADSSATTGLRWQGDYAAGKNKIINGDFRINQRAFTSNTTTATFNFDRWSQLNTGGTFTVTPQTFTPGAAPVAGYEGSTYLQGISAGQSAASDNARFRHKIESVRTLAGQTATISFWAKAATGTPKVGIEMAQEFGTGGGPSPFNSIPVSAVTISTSWARYTATIAIPSLSGKTIGTDKDDNLQLFLWVSAGSDFATRASSIGIQNNTWQFWGVQVEEGSVATAFQTATGTLAGELAACQRYYEKSYNQATALGTSTDIGATAGTRAAGGWATPTTFRVSKRTTPTMTFYSTDGTSGTIRNLSAATNETASGGGIGENGVVTVSGTSSTEGVLFRWHFTASAEL